METNEEYRCSWILETPRRPKTTGLLAFLGWSGEELEPEKCHGVRFEDKYIKSIRIPILDDKANDLVSTKGIRSCAFMGEGHPDVSPVLQLGLPREGALARVDFSPEEDEKPEKRALDEAACKKSENIAT
ncbi:hypothetical protein PUN28_000651 [Cardiocondyla obscurior]|uniref:Uncharacterized protein n=1 Tax=Cardiocondyla obscurior TaxID=286306 RepID=A0AAW2H0U7_9HYME